MAVRRKPGPFHKEINLCQKGRISTGVGRGGWVAVLTSKAPMVHGQVVLRAFKLLSYWGRGDGDSELENIWNVL